MRLLLVALLFPVLGFAQIVVSPNPATVLQASPHKLGLNVFSACDFYGDTCDKNYLANGNNTGFEPQRSGAIFAFDSTQTSTTQFSDSEVYEASVPSGWWVNGLACIIISESSDGNAGQCRKITAFTPGDGSSTTGQYAVGSYLGSAAGFPATPTSGDIMEITMLRSPTSTGDCGNPSNQPGPCNYSSVSGGAVMQGETTDVAADGGTQALDMDATSGTATESLTFDGGSNNLTTLLNQSITFMGEIKTVSGSPTVTLTMARASTNGANCGTHTISGITSTWSYKSQVCVPAEVDYTSGNGSCVAGGTTTACTQTGTFTATVTVTGGHIRLDNVSLMNTASGDAANPTPYSDNLFHTVQAYCAGSSLSGVPCVLRWWTGQNASTFPMLASAGAFVQNPGTAGLTAQAIHGSYVNRNLRGFLVLCQAVGAIPQIEVPSVMNFTSDYAELIDYLGGSGSTTGGAIRIAQGQTAPYTSIFPIIHLGIMNESWNSAAYGEGLPWRSGIAANPNIDYEAFLTPVVAAMQAAPGYSPTAFDIVANSQNITYGPYLSTMAATKIDSIEDVGYLLMSVPSSSLSVLDYDQEAQAYNTIANPSDDVQLYPSIRAFTSVGGGGGLSTCGASGSEPCGVNIYEIGSSPTNCGTDSTCPTQTTETALAAGGYQGTITPMYLMGLQHAYHLPAISYFGLEEYANGGPGGTTMPLWGNCLDFRDNYAIGSQPNRCRPQFYGLELANQAIIGPEISCSITNQPSYSYGGSSTAGNNPPIPAQNPEPYLIPYCFKNAGGTQIAVIFYNANQTTPYTVSFGGTAPSGTVSLAAFNPAAIGTLNEAPTNTDTNLTPAATQLTTSTTTFGGTLSICAGCTQMIEYNVGSAVLAPTKLTGIVIGSNLSIQ